MHSNGQYAIISQQLNASRMLKQCVLGLQKLFGAHKSGQAEIVESIVIDFEIHNTIGFFTMDNASNNFTTIKSILSRVRFAGTWSIEMLQGNLFATTSESRFVHSYESIVNWVVKVFLVEKKALVLATTEENITIEKENLEIKRGRKIICWESWQIWVFGNKLVLNKESEFVK